MPCRSYPEDFPEQAYIDASKKLNIVSRIACQALSALETLRGVMPNDKKNGVEVDRVMNEVFNDREVQIWWEAHKAADKAAKDAERIAQEKKDAAAERKRKRDEVIGKLSPEDRAALGIRK